MQILKLPPLQAVFHPPLYHNRSAARSVVQAFITSRRYYCNSLFVNLANTQMKRLKSIQHKAARLVTRTPLREHITPMSVETATLSTRGMSYNIQTYGPGVGISKGHTCCDLVYASYLWLTDRAYDAVRYRNAYDPSRYPPLVLGSWLLYSKQPPCLGLT